MARSDRRVIIAVIIVLLELAILFSEALETDVIHVSIFILLIWVVFERDDAKLIDWKLSSAVKAVTRLLLTGLRVRNR